jgi:hypothetical protein
MGRRFAAAMAAVALMAVPATAWASSPPPTPMTVSGTVAVSGGGSVPDGTVIHSYMSGAVADLGSPAQVASGSFSGLPVGPTDAGLDGALVGFTVGGLAATAVFDGCSAGPATAGTAVTFIPGGYCTITITVAAPPPTAPVSGTSAATTTTSGTVTAGGSGTAVVNTVATASGGAGTVAVSQYSSNPGPAPTFTSANAYFDVSVAPVSSAPTFTTLILDECGLQSTNQLYWLDNGTWTPVVSQQFDSSTGCVVATLNDTDSSPTISQLTGTAFAVSGPAVGSTGGSSGGGGGGGGPTGPLTPLVTGISPTSGGPGTQVILTGSNFTGATQVYFGSARGTSMVVQSGGEITVDAPTGVTGTVDVTVVGPSGTSSAVAADRFTFTGVATATSVTSAGGVLGTTDGTFSMGVPSGDIAGSGALTLTESTTAPTGLPSGFVAASPTFALAGSALSAPAEAVIQYETSALGGLSAARLAVYTQSASGGWTFVPTLVGSGTVSVSVSGPETLIVLANTAKFSDVPSGYWARADIDALLADGVLSGFPDGTFQPDGALTRAEFVKMLDIVLGLQPGTGTGGFSDVQSGDWFAPYVTAAVSAGLVQGLTATTFGPDQTVSREQMAVFLTRALKLTGSQSLTFSDAGQIDAYATSAVQAAVASGYLSGFPGGTFQPQGATTRAQAAKVLAMAIAHLAPAH